MWIKRAEYTNLKREIVDQMRTNSRLLQLANDWQRHYDESKREVERIKEIAFTRSQILAEIPYHDLVSMAENKYGIMPQNYDDKADLIDEILCVEKRLRVKESK